MSTLHLINHINYPDSQQQIFCRRLNDLITLDKTGKYWDNCLKCPMFNGDYQGDGVECQWRDVYDDTYHALFVSDPVSELGRVQSAIDAGRLKR